jgi:Fe2+ or Zn2+ uptake regulation protein
MPEARGTKVRHTRQAAAVIAAMSRMPTFGDAREIREAARLAGARIGLATVYRHLHLLAEQGRVDVIRGAQGGPCTGCGATASATTSSAGPAAARSRSTGARCGNGAARSPSPQASR